MLLHKQVNHTTPAQPDGRTAPRGGGRKKQTYLIKNETKIIPEEGEKFVFRATVTFFRLLHCLISLLFVVRFTAGLCNLISFCEKCFLLRYTALCDLFRFYSADVLGFKNVYLRTSVGVEI